MLSRDRHMTHGDIGTDEDQLGHPVSNVLKLNVAEVQLSNRLLAMQGGRRLHGFQCPAPIEV